jgi:hypothetical protein
LTLVRIPNLLLLCYFQYKIPTHFHHTATHGIWLYTINSDQDKSQWITSLSSCFTNNVICFMTSRGEISESFTRKLATVFGPLLSLLLNCLLLISLTRLVLSN